jgi:mono/diheme cytochrome c family protein
MHAKKLVLPIVSLYLLVAGCAYNNEEELYPTSITIQDTLIRYTTHIAPLFAANCNSCHSSGTFPNIGTYELAKEHATRTGGVRDRSVYGVGGPMPPTGLMSERNRNLILRWIEADMPE